MVPGDRDEATGEFLSDPLRMMVRMPPDPAATEATDPFAVEAIMARLAEGDAAAVFTLAEHHGGRVANVVRRQLRACGVDRVSPDDVRSLVLDACMELAAVAPAWRPDGALPWWWAAGRIQGLVARWVGVHADALDEQAADEGTEVPAAPSREDSLADTFAQLVERDPLVRLVAQAAEVARVDDVALVCLLDYRIQQDQGDPSPAHTLAPRYGVTPEALRQRISRGRRRLREVVRTDPRFAALADFELVA